MEQAAAGIQHGNGFVIVEGSGLSNQRLKVAVVVRWSFADRDQSHPAGFVVDQVKHAQGIGSPASHFGGRYLLRQKLGSRTARIGLKRRYERLDGTPLVAGEPLEFAPEVWPRIDEPGIRHPLACRVLPSATSLTSRGRRLRH